jgi:pilus assembly protein Flp/PilA
VTCHTQQAGTRSRGRRNSITERALRMLSRLLKLQVIVQNSERGATAVEYGLMVALIAIVIIGAVTLLGGNLSSLFSNVATSV